MTTTPSCPYPACGQSYPTQAEVDDHLVAVPADDPDHQHREGAQR